MKVTAPDGHCLLNSVVTSLKHQLPNLHKHLSLKDLVDKIYSEARTNVDLYNITTYGSTELFLKQLDSYLYQRCYNSEVCDVIPIIISKVLHVHLMIVEKRNNNLNCHQIGDNANQDICIIYKENDHYNSIIPCKMNNQLHEVITENKQGNYIKTKTKKKCNCYKDDNISMCLCKMKTKFMKHNGLNIAQMNCRSMVPKFEEISHIVVSTNIDVLCLTETWLDESVFDSDILIDGFTLFRKDRCERSGGGVAIYIKNDINFVDRSINEKGMLEAIFIEIVTNSNNPNILLSCIYRPPNAKPEIFDNIIDYIECLFSEGKEIVLLGDLNINYKFDETLHENPIHLIENLFGLKQIIEQPTRVTKTSCTLIDVILTSCPQKHVYSGVQDISLSDHNITYTILDISHKKREHREVRYRNYTKFNYEDCKKDFNKLFYNINTNFDAVLKTELNNTKIDECWTLFKNEFLKLSNQYAPFTVRRMKNRTNPWMTPEILKLIYKREYFHKKALNSKDDIRKNEFWLAYKKQRNLVTKTIKEAKLEFYNNATKSCYNNPKKLWSYIRKAVPKQTNNIINDINAEQFNEYFSTIGLKVASVSDTHSKTFDCRLQESIYQFNFMKVSNESVYKILQKLPSESNNDILGFDSKLLTLYGDIICPSLTTLINASLQIGYVPQDWKIARVTPAYKGKGEFNNETNYRPLSVIAHIAKIVESCVQKQLIDFLYKHRFISQDQFAYLKNHSTTFCLHRLIDDVLENMNNKEITGMCFLDIRKCFDTINHKILLIKLAKYGIKEYELKWFESYLSNRSQVVLHNGSPSGKRFINIGVPQGTILGPILFLLYVNDLSNVITKAQINIFADDVVIYSSHNNVDVLKCNLQNTINDVFSWYNEHKLSLSVEKCTTMVIQNRQSSLPIELNLKLGDTPLKQVRSMKYLGTIIDDELKWSQNLNAIAKKININNARIRRAQSTLPLNIRLKIHEALNVPILDYASTVWGNFSSKVVNFISRLEHMSARAISGNYDFYNTRGTTLMTDLNMKPFDYRHKYHKSLLMFKAINGLVPDFLSNYIVFKYEVSHMNLRSFENMELYKPKPSCEKFKKSLMYSGPDTWNSLPLCLKRSSSVHTFKKMYKCIM
jgi:exonuclease III